MCGYFLITAHPASGLPCTRELSESIYIMYKRGTLLILRLTFSSACPNKIVESISVSIILCSVLCVPARHGTIGPGSIQQLLLHNAVYAKVQKREASRKFRAEESV